MATVSRTFACIGSAMGDPNNPNVNYSSSATYLLNPSSLSSDARILYLKFEPFPAALKRNKLISAVVSAYYSGSKGQYASYSATVDLKGVRDFTESAVTYANAPQLVGSCGYNYFHVSSGGSGWPSNPLNLPTTFLDSNDQSASYILAASCVSVSANISGSTSNTFSMNGRLASNKPSLSVQYDDAIKVVYKPVASTFTSGWLNRFENNEFKWTIRKADTAFCAADAIQESAVFQWKLSTANSWNEIPVPNNALKITVPAGTFAGGSINWRIVAIDDLGDTLTSDTYTVSTLAGELKATPASPINNAFADPAGISVFSWTNTNAHLITTQSGADLQYSADGTTWATLGTVTGPTQRYAVPAGTFTQAGTYYWRVRAINVDGETGPWSAAATFSTVDTTMYALPAHPVSEIQDYTDAITFEWTYSSDSGTIPQRTDLQTSVNGVDWTDRATLSAGVLQYTVVAGTFAAGTVYWRVRSYNSNNVAGPWSSTVSFIAYGAPPQPSVSVEAVPFAVIRWQSAGQIAYKISVDGVEFGPYFGTGKVFTLRDYLTDGEHTASVTIQGAYGLWSEAGTAQFTIENVPGDPVFLAGVFDRDAVLTWETDAATADFLIYRDGVQIGHTSGLSFDDRVVLGSHSWKVVNRLPSGNYTESNIVTGSLRSCVTAIALLSGGPWIELKLSENSEALQEFSWSRTASLRHMSGEVWPTLELSAFEDILGRYDVSFPDVESSRAFEAFRGKPVIVKSRGGQAVIGCLASLNKRMKDFYIAYTFSVQRIHWRDYIDADA